VKADLVEPLVYAVILILLLAIRTSTGRSIILREKNAK